MAAAPNIVHASFCFGGRRCSPKAPRISQGRFSSAVICSCSVHDERVASVAIDYRGHEKEKHTSRPRREKTCCEKNKNEGGGSLFGKEGMRIHHLVEDDHSGREVGLCVLYLILMCTTCQETGEEILSASPPPGPHRNDVVFFCMDAFLRVPFMIIVLVSSRM